jgi:hypothetical protein
VTDAYLGYSFVSITSSSQWIAQKLTLMETEVDRWSLDRKIDNRIRSKNIALPPQKLAEIESDMGASLTSLLTEIPFEGIFPFIERRYGEMMVGKIIIDRGRTLQPKATNPGVYPEFQITATMLQNLSSNTTYLREDVKVLLQYMASLRTRIDVLTAEMSRLQNVLSGVKRSSDSSLTAGVSLAAVKHKNENICRRLANATVAQQRLLKRVDLLLQISMEQSTSCLSDVEKVWMQELKRSDKHVRVDLNGRLIKVCGENEDGMVEERNLIMLI